MKLLHFLIINILFLLGSVAAGNVNDAIRLSAAKTLDSDSNVRNKRNLDLNLLVRTLLQNSAPQPAPLPRPKAAAAPAAPPAAPPPAPVQPPVYAPPPGSQFVLPPNVFQPNPFNPNFPNNGFGNINVPAGFVLVTPPPPAMAPAAPPPPATQPPPRANNLNLKQQQKQAFVNLLAAFSGFQPNAPTTQAPPAAPPPAAPPIPPQGILIPTQFLPGFQQQLRDRVLYKYAQYDDISSDAHENIALPPYSYVSEGKGSITADDSYYYDRPVGSTYYPSTSHTDYEQHKFSDSPDDFRISYPGDENDYKYSSNNNHVNEDYFQPHLSKTKAHPYEEFNDEHEFSTSPDF